jgi:monoamine oxidase
MGLANSLKPESIHLNTPAAAITQSNGFVLIRTATGAIFKAKKAIIAIPTNTYADIKFSPSLPLKKNALVSHTKPGIYAKLILSYVEPWWREAGLVGEFTSTKGPVCFSWDTSDPLQSQYSLAVFVAGDAATKWHRLPENKKEAAILDHLATLVGSQLAEKAQDVIEINYTEWTKEEYIGGAPTSSMGPGLLRKYGKAFRQPFGGLHFGGGETAYEWKGYLEGAVTAGQRAAKEVIDALGTKTNE